MTRESQQWEKELKEAGWKPLAAHPNSPTWRDPDGRLYPGPGFAWLVMLEQKEKATMSAQATEPVTKTEALGMVTRRIERPGVIDVPVLEDLLSWRDKLTRWLLKERAAN